MMFNVHVYVSPYAGDEMKMEKEYRDPCPT